MDYNIIEAENREDLIVAVQAWITANPTHSAIGSPVAISVSLWVQGVGKVVAN